MNIFVLDSDPQVAASYHCDMHVVKMILESAQILSTIHHKQGTGRHWMYKATHRNHPCVLWVEESIDNYVWVCELALALCKEYTNRYHKRHKSQDILEKLSVIFPKLDEKGLTQFYQAVPLELKSLTDPVGAYRSFYRYKKHIERKKIDWRHSPVPKWFSIN